MTIIETRVAGYPTPAGRVVLATVLTKDAGDQLAAYVGVLPDLGTADFNFEWVAHHGAKLTERDARQHFDFGYRTYRR